jgi:hypothetical protein
MNAKLCKLKGTLLAYLRYDLEGPHLNERYIERFSSTRRIFKMSRYGDEKEKSIGSATKRS